MKFYWLTDLHLNVLSKKEFTDFVHSMNSIDCDGFLFSGDISNGLFLKKHLDFIKKKVYKPIYLVYGNHCLYWRGFEELSKIKPDKNFFPLDFTPPQIFDDTILTGITGWYDAKWRKPFTPIIYIVDWIAIKDLRIYKKLSHLLSLFEEIAIYYRDNLNFKLLPYLDKYNNFVILTHFPPMHNKKSFLSKFSEWFWKPYNSSKILYDYIYNLAGKYPNKNFIVLSGHTHQKATYNILDNFTIKVGEACLGEINKGEMILL